MGRALLTTLKTFMRITGKMKCVELWMLLFRGKRDWLCLVACLEHQMVYRSGAVAQ